MQYRRNACKNTCTRVQCTTYRCDNTYIIILDNCAHCFVCSIIYRPVNREWECWHYRNQSAIPACTSCRTSPTVLSVPCDRWISVSLFWPDLWCWWPKSTGSNNWSSQFSLRQLPISPSRYPSSNLRPPSCFNKKMRFVVDNVFFFFIIIIRYTILAVIIISHTYSL